MYDILKPLFATPESDLNIRLTSASNANVVGTLVPQYLRERELFVPMPVVICTCQLHSMLVSLYRDETKNLSASEKILTPSLDSSCPI